MLFFTDQILKKLIWQKSRSSICFKTQRRFSNTRQLSFWSLKIKPKALNCLKTLSELLKSLAMNSYQSFLSLPSNLKPFIGIVLFSRSLSVSLPLCLSVCLSVSLLLSIFFFRYYLLQVSNVTNGNKTALVPHGKALTVVSKM